MARTLTAFHLEHVYDAQIACSTESGQVGNYREHTAWRNEPCVFPHRTSEFPAKVGPATMADDSTVGNRNHVRLLEAMAAAEFSEVCDGGRFLAIWIDESIVALDIGALTHAVDVRPPFVRLQLRRSTALPT